ILVGLAIDQIAQSGLSSLSVIYYSAQLFSAININNFFFMFLLACIYDELINGNKIDDKSN
ncbi:hypothetical protein P9939_27270, partial [Serratia nevei]|uniref:hypothetical protein n=1 Tax=Serratia nevei TaxID=2703794 RepID=UPI00254EF178